MKTILSHQSPIINGPDVIIIDGEKNEYTHSPLQEEAASHLHPTSEMKVIHLIRAFGTSNALRLYIDKKSNILISSNFLTKDQKGRKITYLFYCEDIVNTDWLCQRLRDYGLLAGMQVNPEDLKTIKRALDIYAKRNVIGIAAGIIVAVLLTIISKAK